MDVFSGDVMFEESKGSTCKRGTGRETSTYNTFTATGVYIEIHEAHGTYSMSSLCSRNQPQTPSWGNTSNSEEDSDYRTTESSRNTMNQQNSNRSMTFMRIPRKLKLMRN